MRGILELCHNLIKLITANDNRVEISYNRLHVIAIVFICGFVTIAIRLVSLLISPADHIEQKTTHSGSAIIVHRANIVDRNDVLLAVNISTASLYANPRQILDRKEAASKLSQIFKDLSYNQLLSELSNEKKTFIWIKRNLTPIEQQEVNNLGIPGLGFERGERRVYPHAHLLSHVLGYVGVDGRGLAGVERYFDNQLTGDPEHGKLYPESLKLSIDVRVQNIVHEELENSISEFKAIAGVGLVLDAATGEVIASVSLPDFDPHNPGSASSDQLFNRFSLGLYEPGSTFKTYTIAMALDDKIIKLADKYDVSEPMKNSGFRITDYKSKGGMLSVSEIFMHSSNIGLAKIGLEIGKNKQQHFLKAFGMLDPLTIELPEKASPLHPAIADWRDINTITISYGHGIAVTPLHIATVGSAMVNGGILHNATLLKADEKIHKEEVRIIKKSTSEQIRKLFRLVVEHGTGKKANVEGYMVGGKTGTADKAHKGGYNRNSRISSFLAAFPINDPKYVILLMLDEPKGNQSTAGYATAGWTAAPAVARIISRIGTLYGMQTIDENDITIKQQMHLELHDNMENEINSSL